MCFLNLDTQQARYIPAKLWCDFKVVEVVAQEEKNAVGKCYFALVVGIIPVWESYFG